MRSLMNFLSSWTCLPEQVEGPKCGVAEWMSCWLGDEIRIVQSDEFSH